MKATRAEVREAVWVYLGSLKDLRVGADGGSHTMLVSLKHAGSNKRKIRTLLGRIEHLKAICEGWSYAEILEVKDEVRREIQELGGWVNEKQATRWLLQRGTVYTSKGRYAISDPARLNSQDRSALNYLKEHHGYAELGEVEVEVEAEEVEALGDSAHTHDLYP